MMTVYKTVRVVGTSGTSVSDAVRGAVERASQTLEDLKWFEVKEIRGRLVEGEIAEFQVSLDLGFELHAAKNGNGDARKRAGGASTRTGSRGARSTGAQAAARAGERGRSDLARSFKEQPTRRRATR